MWECSLHPSAWMQSEWHIPVQSLCIYGFLRRQQYLWEPWVHFTHHRGAWWLPSSCLLNEFIKIWNRWVTAIVVLPLCCCTGITSRGMILSLRPANERCRYKVKPSLIGWAMRIRNKPRISLDHCCTPPCRSSSCGMVSGFNPCISSLLTRDTDVIWLVLGLQQNGQHIVKGIFRCISLKRWQVITWNSDQPVCRNVRKP